MDTANNNTYCADQVRRHDHDRYLTSLFAPDICRKALYALYAFNLEVAKTREVVSEPPLGRIRLQWWREAIDTIYAGATLSHVVVTALAEAVARHGLTRNHFERLIDAREADLEDQPPGDLEALERYAEETSATLMWLSLEVHGIGGVAVEQAARHIGIAWALSGLLLVIPFHARSNRLYLPRDMMENAGLGTADLFALRPNAALAAVVRQVAEAAHQHLDAARERRTRISRTSRRALLPAVLVGSHLDRLARAGYDPFHPRVAAGGLGKQVRLAVNAALSRY